MKDKNPHIEELTSKVITQEFTTCSLKAVRLADRINEWHQEKVKELERQLQKYKDLYYTETTRADLLQEQNQSDAVEFAEWLLQDLQNAKELYQQFLTSKSK